MQRPKSPKAAVAQDNPESLANGSTAGCIAKIGEPVPVQTARRPYFAQYPYPGSYGSGKTMPGKAILRLVKRPQCGNSSYRAQGTDNEPHRSKERHGGGERSGSAVCAGGDEPGKKSQGIMKAPWPCGYGSERHWLNGFAGD